MITTDFDPQRLVALARARDVKRAYARSLSDGYQTVREERQSVQRRIAHARQNAFASHGFRHEADQQIAALEAQEHELSARLGEIHSEQDCVVDEATEAGSLLRACLSFATEKGLTIPPALADEAKARPFAPLASAGGAA